MFSNQKGNIVGGNIVGVSFVHVHHVPVYTRERERSVREGGRSTKTHGALAG